MSKPEETPSTSSKKREVKPRFKRRIDKAKVVEALKQSMGNVSHAARLLDIPRMTLQDFINKHPDIAEEIQQHRESIADAAEISLRALVIEKDYKAVRFALAKLRPAIYGDRPPAAPQLPPLEAILACLPPDLAEDVRRQLVEALQPGTAQE